MPVTSFQLTANNPIEKIFWGRVPVQHAMAGYYFARDSCLQQLIHQFKYKGRKDIAAFLGRQLGLQLMQSNWWQNISLIIPVPLNKMKMRHRGYNQAAMLANGIADILGCKVVEDGLAAFLGRQLGLQLMQSNWWQSISLIIPVPLNKMKMRHRGYNQAAMLANGIADILGCKVVEDGLARKAHAVTQTHKTRLERWENVAEVFQLNNKEKVKNSHVLLVDDVLTTGATLEACGHALLDAGDAELSICSLAYASR